MTPRPHGELGAVFDAVAGARCFFPEWLEEGGAWGMSLQLYELRSRRNWGIGDFADLADFAVIAAEAGADFVGVNPLHALFLAEPKRCSPFYPSNRRFLNPLYIAVDRLPGFSEAMADREATERLRSSDLVDYEGVTAVKLEALRRLWRVWPGSMRPDLYSEEGMHAFRIQKGEALRRHALFEALSAHMAAAGYGGGWTNWPTGCRTASGGDVPAFAAEHADAVEFHIWLQWLAETQLREAAERARSAGMRIGLYLDFAVGEAPDGSATWSEPGLYVTGVSIGAPPDVFTANGQDWGLTPISPAALSEAGAENFRRMMEVWIRHGGALRIDHAMALWQLFFVPVGGLPAQGAYVRYPIEDLLWALADLSEAHRALVIGEDLGNVPDGFREVMEQAGILSYRILYFESRHGSFIAARDYPRLALACLSTHDLPTLKGWWRGGDVELRLEHGLIDEASAGWQKAERERERRALVAAFAASQAIGPEDHGGKLAAAHDPGADIPYALVVAAHRFIARTPCVLAGVRLADLTGEAVPTNLPGTIDSYPNWRLKLAATLEEMDSLPLFRAVTHALAVERPKAR